MHYTKKTIYLEAVKYYFNINSSHCILKRVHSIIQRLFIYVFKKKGAVNCLLEF
jgi:hypothetical protein